MIPGNELETIVVFAQEIIGSSWEIVSMKSSFPDAVIYDLLNLKEYKAEFEFKASNFKSHGHNLLECDVIICWENDWPDCPIAVWEMKSWDGKEIIPRVDRQSVEISQLRIENKKLRKQLSVTLSDDAQPAAFNIRLSDSSRARALAVLTRNPGITGSELGRKIGLSARMGRNLKAELMPMVIGNGNEPARVEAPEVLE